MAEEVTVEELAESACWALLRTTSVGRLAVWVDDHPDIFPINFAVDHGTVVFRSKAGTKVSAALSDAPVALEADGYDADTSEAWSVVIRGQAEEIRSGADLIETIDLPLFPGRRATRGASSGSFRRRRAAGGSRSPIPGMADAAVGCEARIDGMTDPRDCSLARSESMPTGQDSPGAACPWSAA